MLCAQLVSRLLSRTVPDEIVESVIFALKTFVKVLEEEPDDSLRFLRYLSEQVTGDEAQHRRDIMVCRQFLSC